VFCAFIRKQSACRLHESTRLAASGAGQSPFSTGHSVSLAAANKTLEILDETPALDNIARYGTRLIEGIGKIMSRRGIQHCFIGHPSMAGLFFNAIPPTNYRDWAKSDYDFYETLAPNLHDVGVLVEPDCREPYFICEAHDESCLDDTLSKFEQALDMTLEQLESKNKISVTKK